MDPERTNRTEEQSYAHARSTTRAELLEGLAAAPIGEMRRFTRVLQRRVRREDWRRSMQRRCSFLASAIRACERALGERYAGREKTEGSWHLFATKDGNKTLAVLIMLPPPRRVTDFELPLEIEIVDPNLVDSAVIKAWATRKHRRKGGTR